MRFLPARLGSAGRLSAVAPSARRRLGLAAAGDELVADAVAGLEAAGWRAEGEVIAGSFGRLAPRAAVTRTTKQTIAPARATRESV